MTDHWNDPRPQSTYAKFKEISIAEEWFQVYQIAPHLFVFYEPRHYERIIIKTRGAGLQCVGG